MAGIGSIWDDYLQNLQTGWTPPPGIEGYATGGWSTGGNKAWREAQAEAQGFQRGTDTVKAKLTPGEAVLNRNAAEILGRDAIKRLNDHGNMMAKNGVDLASRGYQMGTENVRRDDRGDLLRDADNTFYGGGQAPAPTPTPTPVKKYQAGTEDVDPVVAARRRRSGYTLPAVNQLANPRNTAFARNAPINTIAQNLNQIPIGGFGLGALQGAGYSRSPQMNLNNFMNQGAIQQNQPQMTGYHWYKGTGGISGGNNAGMDVFYNNGTSQFVNTSVPGQFPPTLANIQYTLPGVNADVRALSDPSVGALDNAQRSTNQYGQQVINPASGGQIISGVGPSYGSLQGSTTSTNAKGQQVLNTPSGGQAIAGPSLRKPEKMTTGDTWSLGGWY